MTAATRAQLHDGSTTETGFFPTPSGQVFYVLERPDRPVASSVLIASPLYSERLKNNRREVLLSRGLARLGIPSMRFHYLDTGNSDATARGPNVASFVESTTAAAQHLTHSTEVAVDVIVGTRLGATIAAHADHDATNYAIWDPAPNASTWLRQVMRTRLIVDMKDGLSVTSAELSDTLNREGEIDIVGFTIAKVLADSCADFRLPEGDNSVKRIHVTLMRKSGLSGSEQRALDAWAEDLIEPMTVVNDDFEEGWWFHLNTNLLEPDVIDSINLATVNRTIDWIHSLGADA